MAKVLYAPMGYSGYDIKETLPSRFMRMLEQSTLGEMVEQKSVAIKMHVGDRLSYSTIPPVFVRILTDFIKSHGGDCFVCDHAIAERKPYLRGYSESVIGCPVLDVCGHLNKYYYVKNVDFKSLKSIDVAGYIHDADVLVDFSHVKGHGSCGYGGACKNIAMGCVTTRTRHAIHRLQGGLDWNNEVCIRCNACIESCNHHANKFNEEDSYSVDYHDCTLCRHCVKVCPTGAITAIDDAFGDFQKGMALSTKTVLDTFKPGSVYFINLLTQITILCDCWGLTTPSLVPDLGIVATEDIVAAEQASLDLIKVENLIPAGLPEGFEIGNTGHLFERIHGKDPFIQVMELEALGLGSRKYETIIVE
ncbi:MAG: NADH dehydrogenase subunit I [Firmicutes bacterium ADurb.Bin182]|nr:MAG: NADH dehydrogenase subunit I [Firmicutes bacterium ADurb.Bin182]